MTHHMCSATGWSESFMLENERRAHNVWSRSQRGQQQNTCDRCDISASPLGLIPSSSVRGAEQPDRWTDSGSDQVLMRWFSYCQKQKLTLSQVKLTPSKPLSVEQTKPGTRAGLSGLKILQRSAKSCHYVDKVPDRQMLVISSSLHVFHLRTLTSLSSRSSSRTFELFSTNRYLMLMNRACVPFCAVQQRSFIKYHINTNLL